MPNLTDVTILYRPEQFVMTVHRETKLENIRRVYSENVYKMSSWLEKSSLFLTDSPFVAYDDCLNLDPECVEIEICFPVKSVAEYPLFEFFEYRVFPASLVASCMCTGGGCEIDYMYGEMISSIAHRGYSYQGCAYEYYYNHFRDPIPEKEYITQVVLPLTG